MRPLGDLLPDSYHKLVLNESKYACGNVPFLLKCNYTKIELLHCYFLKILIIQSTWYSAEQLIWKISIFAKHLQWLLLLIQQIPMINTYFFLLLKLLHAIAKSCLKVENRKNKYMLNLFLQRQDVTKIKLPVGNSAITEVNELKIFTLQVFKFTF